MHSESYKCNHTTLTSGVVAIVKQGIQYQALCWLLLDVNPQVNAHSH